MVQQPVGRMVERQDVPRDVHVPVVVDPFGPDGFGMEAEQRVGHGGRGRGDKDQSFNRWPAKSLTS